MYKQYKYTLFFFTPSRGNNNNTARLSLSHNHNNISPPTAFVYVYKIVVILLFYCVSNIKIYNIVPEWNDTRPRAFLGSGRTQEAARLILIYFSFFLHSRFFPRRYSAFSSGTWPALPYFRNAYRSCRFVGAFSADGQARILLCRLFRARPYAWRRHAASLAAVVAGTGWGYVATRARTHHTGLFGNRYGGGSSGMAMVAARRMTYL